MVKLKDLFAKPVDRTIEGVIKADDDASIRLELEEYVLTNEVAKRLELFLDAYNNFQGANGVWISGFFGSGKSHLLKMLALLLDSRDVDGLNSLDVFLEKADGNEILRADLKRAASIPSRSLLFNIDQKADVISKSQIDALLAVFVKVFDESCGYYGKQGYIARFERDLDSRGILTAFQAKYESIAGRPWTTGREQALLEDDNISTAYREVSGADDSTAKGILGKYRAEYRVSIEDFANQVKDFIDKKERGFRLNFFVDEVGQYIAENVKLMTNLQTIAESLATKCRGQAWIIVTSQNDMSTVLGEMNRQQSNDFSKIMARFANKMLLTSTDVAEVIQRRLLAKTEDAAELLSDLYHQHFNNFGTMFGFGDGSREYRGYQDRDEFIRCYPFVPYQFDLFQSSIENLSRHNAFEGKHSSVGERSMLGVFQGVVKHEAESELNKLASFDAMYAGIETALKAQSQGAILEAARQLNNEFALRVLRALFLVKYVKEFKSSVRNICILMLDRLDQDLTTLKQDVEGALRLLEQQNFIQRNGELYEFLTDEEKDVEQEIRNTEIDSATVAGELEKLIFEYGIKARKIRDDESGQDYPFTKKLDDRIFGREYELSIHVISPFNEHSGNENTIRMQSMGRDELVVVLPADDRLIPELLKFKRTEKYVRQNISTTQQESVRRILNDNLLRNQERERDLKTRIRELLSNSKLIVSAGEIEVSFGEPQSRIATAFCELVSRVYPNLNMLRGLSYSENDISRILNEAQSDLFTGEAIALSESEQEILSVIQGNSRTGVRTTIKSLIDRFEKKPYGWYYAAVLCTIAKLFAAGKVEMRLDGNLLNNSDAERALRNSNGHVNVVLDPQIEYTASQVRKLKEFLEDFFDQPPRASEAKALGLEASESFHKLHHELFEIQGQSQNYPFLSVLGPLVEQSREIAKRPYSWFFTDFPTLQMFWLEQKESLIDPIRSFMAGQRKVIFDEVRNFVIANENNFPYLASSPIASFREFLEANDSFRGEKVSRVRELKQAVAENLRILLEGEKEKATRDAKLLYTRVEQSPDFSQLDEPSKRSIESKFKVFGEMIQHQTLIPVIRDSARRFEEEEYRSILALLSNGVATADSQAESDFEEQTRGSGSNYVLLRSLVVPFPSAWLADVQDVETYVRELRAVLAEEIEKGNRVQI